MTPKFDGRRGIAVLIFLLVAGLCGLSGGCSSDDAFTSETFNVAAGGGTGTGALPGAAVINNVTPADATAGTAVTIIGDKFKQPSGWSWIRLEIGGDNMSIDTASWTDTQVTATIPADAYTGAIIMGTGTSSADEYTSNAYVYGVKPTVTSIDLASGAAGTNITLNGTGFNHVTFGDNTVFFDDVSLNRQQATATSVIVQAGDNALSCTVPASLASGAYSVYVQVSSSGVTTCSSETVTFTVL